MANGAWMMKYGMAKFSPRHMTYILVGAWDALNVSSVNITRERFVKTNLPPLSPPRLTKNTQACAISIQVSSGAKDEEINNISRHAVAPIEIQVTSTNDPMVVFRAKGKKQSLRNIILQTVAYDAAVKITVTHIH